MTHTKTVEAPPAGTPAADVTPDTPPPAAPPDEPTSGFIAPPRAARTRRRLPRWSELRPYLR
ncbi:MAG TPA: hypothetical protein VGJ46_05250, partial [Candidatus Limnocylindrales bacterium]